MKLGSEAIVIGSLSYGVNGLYTVGTMTGIIKGAEEVK